MNDECGVSILSAEWKVHSAEWKVHSGKCRVHSGKCRVHSGKKVKWKVGWKVKVEKRRGNKLDE